MGKVIKVHPDPNLGVRFGLHNFADYVLGPACISARNHLWEMQLKPMTCFEGTFHSAFRLNFNIGSTSICSGILLETHHHHHHHHPITTRGRLLLDMFTNFRGLKYPKVEITTDAQSNRGNYFSIGIDLFILFLGIYTPVLIPWIREWPRLYIYNHHIIINVFFANYSHSPNNNFNHTKNVCMCAGGGNQWQEALQNRTHLFLFCWNQESHSHRPNEIPGLAPIRTCTKRELQTLQRTGTGTWFEGATLPMIFCKWFSHSAIEILSLSKLERETLSGSNFTFSKWSTFCGPRANATSLKGAKVHGPLSDK